MSRARDLADSADKDFAGTVTVDNIVVDTDLSFATGATVTTILDEDAMGTDSATALATQQSIKAYVDTQVATVPTGDITEVTAGTGLSGGGTTGAVTLNIDSTVATLTGTQTLTNKTLTAPTITGTSFVSSGNMTFGDNDKAIFGGGSDLQIYHSGLHSYIDDTGTGDLRLRGNAGVYLGKYTGESMVDAIADGAVTLYYDNVAKLATTATGVDVTGTAVTDGLTVAGNVSVDGGTIKLDGNYPVGTGNVALGDTSLSSITTGANNTSVGHQASYSITTGANNTAIGRQVLYNNTGDSNTGVGYRSLYLNTTGINNVALGSQSLYNNTTAANNTAVGYQAGYSNTTGVSITAVGFQALYNNTTGSYNTAIGDSALRSNTSGDSATAVGWQALYSQTTGGGNNYNVAIGRQASYSNVNGYYNVAVGGQAFYSNSSGFNNTAIGHQALNFNTTGNNNTAVGYLSLKLNTTGADNAATGMYALLNNSTGNNNTAFGKSALQESTTASNNIGVGYQAGYSNTASDGNVYLGWRAGYLQNNANSGLGYNTLLGAASGLNLTSGYYNTFVGQSSGYYMTTGYKNIILGSFTGNQGGLDIRTANNHIVLSDGNGNPTAVCAGAYGAWVFGGTTYQAANDSQYSEFQAISSSVQLGLTRKSTSTGTGYIGADNSYVLRVFSAAFSSLFQVDTSGNVTSATGSYGTISDQRFKENIEDSGSQWDDIKAIQVKKYSMIEDGLDAPNQIGVIAQDLEASGMSGLVTTTDVPDVQGDNATEMKTVKYSILYMKAVKALQEAMERIETLEAKVAAT